MMDGSLIPDLVFLEAVVLLKKKYLEFVFCTYKDLNEYFSYRFEKWFFSYSDNKIIVI